MFSMSADSVKTNGDDNDLDVVKFSKHKNNDIEDETNIFVNDIVYYRNGYRFVVDDISTINASINVINSSLVTKADISTLVDVSVRLKDVSSRLDDVSTRTNKLEEFKEEVY